MKALISAKLYSSHFYNIAKFIVFSTFASEFMIYTDNEYTDFFFPTYVCLRFLGDIDRMHPIL